MITLLLAVALGQDMPDAPAVSSQNLRVSVDGRQLISTDLSGVRGGQRGALRLLTGYAYRPLVLASADGATTDYVRDLAHLDLAGGYTFGPVRVGAHLPLFFASGELGSGVGIGDLGLDARVTALNGAKAPVGLAFAGRVVAPTTSLSGVAMRTGGVSWEAGVILDGQAGPALIAANLGFEGGPVTTLIDTQRWGERFSARIGTSIRTGPVFDLGLEADAAVSLRGPGDNGYGVPAELLASGTIHSRKGAAVLIGLGAGVSRGIGTPAVRALLGVSWERPTGWGTPVTEPVAELPPEETVCWDGRPPGVVGCPPPNVRVRVRLVDPDGRAIDGATATLDGRVADGDVWALPAGAHLLDASHDGYSKVSRELVVPGDVEAWEALITLMPATAPARLAVRARGADGTALDATVLLDGTMTPELLMGSTALKAGEHMLDVSAEGYGPVRMRVSLPPGSEETVDVVLTPQRVSVGQDVIELSERVHFETASDVILAESFPLLGELASTLSRHPELALVAVEGHTDSRGSDTYNLDLSQRRAASVVRFLVGLGVAPDRLISVGYGERLPMSNQPGEAGWALNRRVELHILQRAE